MYEYAHYVTAGVDISSYAEGDIDPDGNSYDELYYSRGMAKCIVDDSQMAENDIALVLLLESGYRRAVIQRDTDLLTEAELVSHRPAVEAAILEERRRTHVANLGDALMPSEERRRPEPSRPPLTS